MGEVSRAAIISGIFVIVAPILAYIFTKHYENKDKDFLTISQSRKIALDGSWNGKVFQAEWLNGQPINYPFTITLDVSKKEIKGTGIVHFPMSKTEIHSFNISLKGGFLHDRFLKLDYKNTNQAAMQFGSLILNLSSDGKKLTGRFLGYGSKTEKLVFGELKLEKGN